MEGAISEGNLYFENEAWQRQKCTIKYKKATTEKNKSKKGVGRHSSNKQLKRRYCMS